MTIGSAAFLTGSAPAALQRFSRSFPPAVVPDTASPRRAPPVPLANDWPNSRILVVEPQAVVAFDLQRILRNAGYQVIGPAATAVEARRLIDRRPVDGAILDLDLHPSAVSAVVDLLEDAAIPIIFLSGVVREQLPERHRDRPLVQKPYTEATLLAAVRQALEPAKGEDEGEFLYPISPPPMPWPRVFPQL